MLSLKVLLLPGQGLFGVFCILECVVGFSFHNEVDNTDANVTKPPPKREQPHDCVSFLQTNPHCFAIKQESSAEKHARPGRKAATGPSRKQHNTPVAVKEEDCTRT